MNWGGGGGWSGRAPACAGMTERGGYDGQGSVNRPKGAPNPRHRRKRLANLHFQSAYVIEALNETQPTHSLSNGNKTDWSDAA